MRNNLTKQHIAQSIADTNGFSTKQSAQTLETLIEIIKRTLESGEDVLVSGFGKFCVKEKTRRRGRNPATGKNMFIQPRRVVRFKCSRKLRELVDL